MSYNHQPQLSVNSVQSLVEPVTPPPIGQMNNKKNHQKTQSLDLSGFNQFITSQSPMMLYNNNNSAFSPNGSNTLPLINEFDASLDRTSVPSNSASSNSSTITIKNNYNNNHNKHQKHKDNKNRHNNNNNNNNNASSVSISGSLGEINSTSLEDLDYVKLATDQFGCRFLQKKLESNSKAESVLVRDLMFEQIKPYFINLILDPFGNYLIQKLCEYLTVDQKTVLIDSIYPSVFKISINQYGTRSLQKIIDTVDNEAQIDLIVKGFSPAYTSIDKIVVLINDLNGNHVIQKCIFKFPSSKFDFIINAIIDKNNIITISTHKHGCCVLQKLLSVCTLQQIFKISIKIIQFLPGLINDQFGNYIIQFLLDIKELDFYLLIEIFNKLSKDLCQLSCLKFSSNVIEKFIKKIFGVIIASVKGEVLPNINDDIVNNMMNILLAIIDIFTMKLNILIRDNFGNYALQTLLDVRNYSIMLEFKDNNFIATNNPKYLNFSHDFTTKIATLVSLTKDLLPSIKTTSYAKKIKLKVKAYSELTGIDNNGIPSAATSGQLKTVNSNNNIANTRNNNNSNRKQHQRHFSLPANAYHRRTSSSVVASNSNLIPIQNQQQLNNIQTSMSNIFNSQNSSPLSINQYQQMEYMNVNKSGMLPPSMNGNSNVLSTQNGLNFSNTDFDLAKPLANLTLNSNFTSQPMFFMKDVATTNNNVSTSSSSSNLFQNNGYSSTSSSTINGGNNNNNFMNTSNLMNSSTGAFNTHDRNNSSGNFDDLKKLSLQPQQRIISNPFPNTSTPFGSASMNSTSTSTNNSQMYGNNNNLNSMNTIPSSGNTTDYTKLYGYY